MTTAAPETDSATRLLDAAISLFSRKGFSATTVDEICQRSGLTKGGFFHYFKGKEHLAVEAARHAAEAAARRIADAPFQGFKDPLERVLGYLEFHLAEAREDLPHFTTLLGTLARETSETYPSIRAACERALLEQRAPFTRDIEEARRLYAPEAPWSAESLSLHIQGVLLGASIMARALGTPDGESIRHLSRYVELLFTTP